MLRNETLLCFSSSTCPTVYVNKHLSCLTYERVPSKGRNYVGTRNFRFEITLNNIKISTISYPYFGNFNIDCLPYLSTCDLK